MHITCCWPVLRRECDHDVRVSGSNRRRIAVGEVDAAIRQSDVVDHSRELGGWYLIADLGLHAVTQGGRLFNTQAGRSAEMQRKFAAVHGWEEVLSQPRVKPEGEYAHGEKGAGKNAAVTDTSDESPAICGANPLKVAFKPRLKQHKRILAGGVRAFFSMSFEEILGHGRHESPRKQVGSQHCEDNGLRHGHK